MKSIRTTIISFLIGLKAFGAGECTSVSLEEKLGPIRNQRDKGWCFANTAADLLTYSYHDELKIKLSSEVRSSSHEQQVSSMFGALIYFEAQLENTTNSNSDGNLFGDGGYIAETIDIVQKKGFLCSQKLDEDLMVRGLKDKTLSEKLQVFVDLYNLYQSFLSGNKTVGEKIDALIKLLQESDSLLNDFPRSKLAEAMSMNTLDKATMGILNLACKQSKTEIARKPVFEHIFITGDDNEVWHKGMNKSLRNFSFENEIKKVFDQESPKPVGISYYLSQIVSRPSFGTGFHASVLTGRKMIDGICHYQIRNSWGNDCNSAEYDNDGNYVPLKIYKYACDNGTIWVPGNILDTMVKEVVYQK